MGGARRRRKNLLIARQEKKKNHQLNMNIVLLRAFEWLPTRADNAALVPLPPLTSEDVYDIIHEFLINITDCQTVIIPSLVGEATCFGYITGKVTGSSRYIVRIEISKGVEWC